MIYNKILIKSFVIFVFYLMINVGFGLDFIDERTYYDFVMPEIEKTEVVKKSIEEYQIPNEDVKVEYLRPVEGELTQY